MNSIDNTNDKQTDTKKKQVWAQVGGKGDPLGIVQWIKITK